jgi:hypothetical protein
VDLLLYSIVPLYFIHSIEIILIAFICE